jgi:heme/copper-type cytochrome/quinol oxidase subunit 4
VVLSTSILAIGTFIESKLKLMNGLGAILVLASIQVLVTYVALNPFSNKDTWTILAIILYAAVVLIAIYLTFQTQYTKNKIKTWL